MGGGAKIKAQILFAFSFLTIIPLGAGEDPQGSRQDQQENLLARAAAFFPLVGGCLGLFLVCGERLFSLFCPPNVSVVAVLALESFLTAGLHLDGFADTCDGLGAGLKKGRAQALEVMRDGSLGAWGVAGLIFLLLFKFSLLANFLGSPLLFTLLLMPVAGRWLLTLGGRIYPYARAEAGLGEGFAGKVKEREVALASFLLLLFLICGALLASSFEPGGAFGAGAGFLSFIKVGLIGLAVALGGSLALATPLARWLGGVTGDTLGALNETAEALFLLGVSLGVSLG